MKTWWRFEKLSAAEGREHLEALAEVLRDCVEGGTSVSLAPFTKSAAERFFVSVLDEVEAGVYILLAAFADGRLVGTVQIVTATLRISRIEPMWRSC